jgi:hypothetical protein
VSIVFIFFAPCGAIGDMNVTIIGARVRGHIDSSTFLMGPCSGVNNYVIRTYSFVFISETD